MSLGSLAPSSEVLGSSWDTTSYKWTGDHVTPFKERMGSREEGRECYHDFMEENLGVEPTRLRFRKCAPKLPSLENTRNLPIPSENFNLSAFKKKLVPHDGNHVLWFGFKEFSELLSCVLCHILALEFSTNCLKKEKKSNELSTW